MKTIFLALGLLAIPALSFAQTASNQIGTAALSGSQAAVENNFSPSPSDQTLRTAPAISSPTLYTMSTCGTPISGTLSVIGFGAAAGTVVYNEDCKHEQEDEVLVPLLGKLGYSDMAFALLCESSDVEKAALAVHEHCPTVASPIAIPASEPASEPVQPVSLKSEPTKENCHQVFVAGPTPGSAGHLIKLCE